MQKKTLRALNIENFQKGTWQSISTSLASEKPVKLGLNLNSDEILGELISRKGSTLVGAQLVNDKPVLGLHNFRDSGAGAGSKLFAVLSDGTNNDIYDVIAGIKSLENDTKDLKTRFLTYLNSCLRLNGTDSPKSYNGVSWISSPTGANFTAEAENYIRSNSHGLLDGDVVSFTTTNTLPAGLSLLTNYYVRDKLTDRFKISLTKDGPVVSITDTGTGTHTWTYWNPFDLDNLPQTSKYAVEFKDRVYVAGRTDYPDRVDISGISNSTTRTVSWTVGNRFINFEQEDGGGDIVGLAKVPGYVLVFKKRTLKRYDGSSAYPEDMINEGAPSQEAITVAKGVCFWVNENGAWASSGGVPQKISSYSVDDIIKSCSASDLANVSAGTDEDHIFWSFASVTISGETYTNVVLKFNYLQNTWDVRKYPTLHRVHTKYLDSNEEVFLVTGDDDGNVLKLDVGTTDNSIPIVYSLETHDIDFGYPTFKKSLKEVAFLTSGVAKAEVKWKTTDDYRDWKNYGLIDTPAKTIRKALIDYKFNFKITATTDSGQERIKGIYFPEGTEVLSQV